MIVEDISKVKLIDKFGETISKKKIINDYDELNNFFLKNKFKKLIFLLVDNSYPSIIFYISLLKSGHTITLINSNIKSQNLIDLINIYKPNDIITKRILDLNFYQEVYKLHGYNCYKIKKKKNHYINEELFFLLTTSGSTGSSKLVRLSYKNIESNTKSIVKFLSIKSSDKLITTLPPDYTYGFSQINTHLYKSSTIILNDYSIIQRDFWELLCKTQATTFGGVPYTYELLKKIKFENYNLSSLKYITQAGGKLSKENQKYFYNILKKKKIKLIIMYGATEATSRMSYLPWSKCKNKIGSIGIPIPGSKMEIIKPNNKKIGEILFKGTNVSLGYANSFKDLKKGDLNNGKLYTGDLGFRDNQGYYFIIGRKKRFLKIVGHRISLDELEIQLRNFLKYKSIYCTGTDNELVVLVGKKQIKNNLLNCLLKEYKINKNLIKIKFFNKIILTSSGKINYEAINENSI